MDANDKQTPGVARKAEGREWMREVHMGWARTRTPAGDPLPAPSDDPSDACATCGGRGISTCPDCA